MSTRAAQDALLLSLLPDNTSGAISASDIRSVFDSLENNAVWADTGSGAPVTIPERLGDVYVDTSTSPGTVYVATGTSSSADYKILCTLSGTQTLTNKTLTTPVIGTIRDANGNEAVVFAAAGSAVNYPRLLNSATGNDVEFAAAGDDTNIGISLTPKGTGNVSIGNFVFNADAAIGPTEDNYVLTYDDASGTWGPEVATGGGGGITQEQAEDAVAQMFTNGTQTRVTVQYSDATPSLSLTVDDNLANYDNSSTSFISNSSTDTLSNKTINSSSNTITLNLTTGTLSGTKTQFNSALSDGSFQYQLAEGAFVDGDKTKLNGIETGATADQSAAEIAAMSQDWRGVGAETLIAATAALEAAASAGVSDGDKGDITVTASGATWTIDNNVVTNVKAADMAQDTIKGRVTAGSGDPEDLTAAQVRTLINVENGATADQSDAEIETAYNNQVAVVGQAEAEAGVSTTVRRWTSQRVAQAIAALGSGSVVSSGSGAPASTPSTVGDVYIDLTNDVAYIATDTVSSADWDEILTSASGSVLTDTPIALTDKLPFFDTSDSNNPKMDDLQDALKLKTEALVIACSDETTDLTTGTAKATFRMPYAFTLTAVRASVTTAPTGSVLTVDINEGGTSILSTKLTIDATEKTSTTAATAAVISDSSLADDAEITVDIDTVGSTVAGAGLKVTLIGYQT